VIRAWWSALGGAGSATRHGRDAGSAAEFHDPLLASPLSFLGGRGPFRYAFLSASGKSGAYRLRKCAVGDHGTFRQGGFVCSARLAAILSADETLRLTRADERMDERRDRVAARSRTWPHAGLQF